MTNPKPVILICYLHKRVLDLMNRIKEDIREIKTDVFEWSIGVSENRNSNLAANVDWVGGQSGEKFNDTEKLSVKQSISSLLQTAGKEDWDGEGALPVVPETVRVAEELVDFFPAFVDPPEVSASPQGEIDFDWVESREVMLTVSVCPSGEIAFAGIFDGLRMLGRKPWEDEVIRLFLRDCFRNLGGNRVSESVEL